MAPSPLPLPATAPAAVGALPLSHPSRAAAFLPLPQRKSVRSATHRRGLVTPGFSFSCVRTFSASLLSLASTSWRAFTSGVTAGKYMPEMASGFLCSGAFRPTIRCFLDELSIGMEKGAFVQRKRNFFHQEFSRNLRDAAGGIRCSQLKLEDGVDDETCELVSGIELVIGEGEDTIRAYLLKAIKNNNGTGVLLLSDIFGFEDSSTRDFAYRIACNGYNVLVPDMFRGNPWRKGKPKTEFEHWLIKQLPERVANDVILSSQWMIDEFVAAGISKKLGIIGFCFGGRYLIETLAHDEHAYFGTGVCFNGTNMNPSLASNIKVPVLFICGDNDPLCPVSVVHDMEKNIRDSKVVVYHDRGHGFAHRPESQEEDDDAEDAFAATRTWLHDCLLEN